MQHCARLCAQLAILAQSVDLDYFLCPLVLRCLSVNVVARCTLVRLWETLLQSQAPSFVYFPFRDPEAFLGHGIGLKTNSCHIFYWFARSFAMCINIVDIHKYMHRESYG